MAPVFVIAVLTMLAPLATVPRGGPRADTSTLAGFHARIAEYVEIHRTAAAGLADSILCADPEELSRQSAVLAAAIRRARPIAAEGDIFTIVVASALRVRIAEAVRASTFALTAAVNDDEGIRLDVYDAIHAGTWEYSWAPLIRALPDLPPELEYQFVGRHLVLVDTRANLVVDVLRHALPAARRVRDIGPAGPCDVHPDLPACWM